MNEKNFKEVLNEYLDYLKLKNKMQSFYKIKSRIDLFIIPYIDLNKKTNEYTINDYIKFQNIINEKNFNYNYKKIIHYTYSSFFSYMYKNEYINKNIPKIVGNFKNNEINKKEDFWTIKEFKKFIKVVDNFEYKVLFEFLFYTGCRIGEVLALNWNDLNNNIITINKTITKENYDGKRIITSPKTKTSNRSIYIDFFLKKELKKLYKYYRVDNKNNFIFGNNKPFSNTTITRYKNLYCSIAKVKQIKIHNFRHSHATFLVSKKVPIKVVSDRLGHSNIDITLNTYTHLLKKDKKRVLKTLNLTRIIPWKI